MSMLMIPRIVIIQLYRLPMSLDNTYNKVVATPRISGIPATEAAFLLKVP